MYEFHPYFTNDGSVGLYNAEFDDIYHSASGALNEAYEKFIYPIEFDKLLKKESIKVLDICYGIGYNSKSFLNYLFEKKIYKTYKCTDNIATIHTNNILSNIDNNSIANNVENYNIINKYNDKIYTNNIFPSIYIKAIDNDKILTYLSPFIKTGEKKIKNNHIDFNYGGIEKFLKNKIKVPKKKIHEVINFLLLEKIIEMHPDILENTDVIKILEAKEYDSFFDLNIKGMYEFLYSNRQLSDATKVKLSYLHNIYYKYVSKRYKKALKDNYMQDIIFELKNGDARHVIQEDDNLYNLIFLDAFTPTKCPCLWSLEFFQLLYKHLDDDGVILTYSSSASVRNAMLMAGLYVGKVFNDRENKFIGTIASKNKSMIKYNLSESDLSLLKTKAGIFYRDENLISLNEAIIERRNFDYKNSTLISSSQYYKRNKGK